MVMKRFEVVQGLHNQDGRLYEVGDVVENSIDLCKRFNCPGSIKFKEVPAGTPLSEGTVVAGTGRPASSTGETGRNGEEAPVTKAAPRTAAAKA